MYINKIETLILMGFSDKIKNGHVSLHKKNGNVLTMLLDDVLRMNEDEFIHFQNNIIEWLGK